MQDLKTEKVSCSLSDDILLSIFSHLNLFDLLRASFVSKSWNIAANYDDEWVNLLFKHVHPFYLFGDSLKEKPLLNSLASVCEKFQRGLFFNGGKMKAKLDPPDGYFSLHISIRLTMSGDYNVEPLDSSEFGTKFCRRSRFPGPSNLAWNFGAEGVRFSGAKIILPPGKFDLFWKFLVDADTIVRLRSERLNCILSFPELGIINHKVHIPMTQESLKPSPQMSEIFVASIEVGSEACRNEITVEVHLARANRRCMNGVYIDSFIFRQTEEETIPSEFAAQFQGAYFSVFAKVGEVHLELAKAIGDVYSAMQRMEFSRDRADFVHRLASLMHKSIMRKGLQCSLILLLKRAACLIQRCNCSGLYAILLEPIFNNELDNVINEMDSLLLGSEAEIRQQLERPAFKQYFHEELMQEVEISLVEKRSSLVEVETLLGASDSLLRELPHLSSVIGEQINWVREHHQWLTSPNGGEGLHTFAEKLKASNPMRALRYFKYAAMKGWRQSSWTCGEVCEESWKCLDDKGEVMHIQPRNTEEAVTHFKSVCEGQPRDFSERVRCMNAMLRLGVCYYRGSGVARDKAMADKYFKKCWDCIADVFLLDRWSPVPYLRFWQFGVSAGKSEVVCLLEEAVAASVRNNHRQNFTQHYWEPETLLGICYLDGMGVTLSKKKERKAFNLLRRAANKKYGSAMLALAYCLHTGHFEDESYKPTKEELAKGGFLNLDESDPIGQCFMGLCCLNGIFFPQNEAVALSWLEKSSAGEYWTGQHWLGRCLWDKGDKEGARKLLELAGNQGYAESQLWLSRCYTESNPHLALEWMKKAAEQGHEEAIAQLCL